MIARTFVFPKKKHNILQRIFVKVNKIIKKKFDLATPGPLFRRKVDRMLRPNTP